MNRGKRIILITLFFAVATSTAKPNNFLQKYWVWFASILPAAAIAWDTAELIRGKHANKTWLETTKSSYKGILGLTSLPILYAINRHFQKQQTPVAPIVTKCSVQNGECKNNVVIEQYIIPTQKNGSDCGPISLYNCSCLASGNLSQMYDETTRNASVSKWKNDIKSDTSCCSRYGNDCSENIHSLPMEFLIKKEINPLYDPKNNSGSFLKENFSIIESIQLLKDALLGNNTEFIAGHDRHTLNNIIRFQKYGTSQIILIHTSSSQSYNYSYNNPYSGHWLTIKLERLGKNSLKAIIVDSFNYLNANLARMICDLFTTNQTGALSK